VPNLIVNPIGNTNFDDQFCKNWQFDRCQNQHCKRLHKFAIDDSIKKMCYRNDFPTSFHSSIAWIYKNNTNFIPVKMGNRVMFLTYNSENNQLTEVNFMHQIEQEMMYFRCEQDNLLYAY
jgi:hypothetical protein